MNCSCPSLERTDRIKYLGVTLDQTLTFRPHIQVLTSRLRKLIHIFKTLKQVTDIKTIKMVYYALCQSIVDYCITSWGGAAKTHLIQLERAHRAVLKVSAGHPYRFPTSTLYKEWALLTVRQSFILQTVLKNHSELQYDPSKNKDKRRKGTVCHGQTLHSEHSHHFFCFLGPYLYNKINSRLTIYPLTKASAKKVTSNWLKTLDYIETENLLRQSI